MRLNHHITSHLLRYHIVLSLHFLLCTPPTAAAGLEPDEEAALQAELAQRRLVLYRLEQMKVGGGDEDAVLAKNDGMADGTTDEQPTLRQRK